jgi:hypothetical protein
MKKGTRATNKNTKADDIIVSKTGNRYRVWSEAGAMVSIPVLHKIDKKGKVEWQSPMNLTADKEAPFVHAGEKYVEPPPKKPEPTEEYVWTKGPVQGRAKLGWIAPDGRFFGCEYGEHNRLSYRLNFHELDRAAEPSSANFGNDNERSLEAAGWLKVYSGLGIREAMIHSPPEHVRQIKRAQGDTILAFCAATKQKIPFWLDAVSYEVK